MIVSCLSSSLNRDQSAWAGRLAASQSDRLGLDTTAQRTLPARACRIRVAGKTVFRDSLSWVAVQLNEDVRAAAPVALVDRMKLQRYNWAIVPTSLTS